MGRLLVVFDLGRPRHTMTRVSYSGSHEAALLELAQELESLFPPDHTTTAFVSWRGRTLNALTRAFGQDDDLVQRFKYLRWHSGGMYTAASDHEHEFEECRRTTLGLIEVALDRLKDPLPIPSPRPHATADIERHTSERSRVMNAIFEEANGSEGAHVRTYRLGEILGLDGQSLANALHYLIGEGLVRSLAGVEEEMLPTHVTLTHRGIQEIEQSHKEPSKATEHLPAHNTVTYNIHGDVHTLGSQVGSIGATQTVTAGDVNLSEVRSVIELIRDEVLALLGDDDAAEVLADVQSVESQLASPRPKPAIVREGLRAVEAVVVAAGGLVAGTGILDALGRLHL